MTTEITSLSELNSSDVAEQQAILTEFLQNKYPDIDISHGVMHDLVQYVNAIFSAKEREELERWKSARSLLAITENGDLADTDSVDNILSNYNVARKPGSYAMGTIMLEFTDDISYVIPVNTAFTCKSIRYETVTSYLIYPSNNTDSAVADRVLTRLDNGNYGCTVDVVAREIGSIGCIKRGTLLNNTDIPNLNAAYAYNDFYGGVDAESNTVLMAKLKDGIATPCWGNRNNIASLLYNNEATSGIVAISVIGFGDAEMQRDQITLFPISTGGKTDIYVKTAPYTITNTVTLPATLSYSDISYNYWTVTVPSTALPGFWRVTGVYPTTAPQDSNSLELVSQQVIPTKEELKQQDACYTNYQNVVVQFKTIVENSITPGMTKDFNIVLMGIPAIDTVQKICSDRAIIPVASDVLIKAAVPCIISAEIKIKQSKANVVSDDTLVTMRDTITKYINNKGFTGYVTSAELSNAIKELLGDGQTIAYIQLVGTILGPNNILYREASAKQIVIPDMPLNYITKNTTTFFSDITYIDITTECVDE